MSLKYALLGLISKKPQTGYELYTTFKERMIYFWSSTHSQIYTELNKMEHEEWISSTYIYQEGSPNKKLYTITTKGEEYLLNWLLSDKIKPAKIKDEFLLRASAFHLLSEKEIIHLLDAIIEREQRVLEATRKWQHDNEQDEEFGIGDFVTAEYGVMYAEMYIKWCEKVRKEIRKRSRGN
ncbi:PadR family transcriptional regulator [Exiguobacterium qingdaonense]|uniref:PadR family transcriptional regulator n=1 Tax=Exiguobacterium qingdaonense TaxID=2751251 RepID=UPI001BE7F551|nr:PadR family transcriptional regulator [Exiguobacterium qingdaonense]